MCFHSTVAYVFLSILIIQHLFNTPRFHSETNLRITTATSCSENLPSSNGSLNTYWLAVLNSVKFPGYFFGYVLLWNHACIVLELSIHLDWFKLNM